MNALRLTYEEICKEFKIFAFDHSRSYYNEKNWEIIETDNFLWIKKRIEWGEKSLHRTMTGFSYKVVDSEKYIWFSVYSTMAMWTERNKRLYPRHIKHIFRLSKKTGSLLNITNKKYAKFSWQPHLVSLYTFFYSLSKNTQWVSEVDLAGVDDKNNFRKYTSFRSYLQSYNAYGMTLPIKELKKYKVKHVIDTLPLASQFANPEFALLNLLKDGRPSIAQDYIRMYDLVTSDNPNLVTSDNAKKPFYNKNIRKAHDDLLEKYLERKVEYDKTPYSLSSTFEPLLSLPKEYSVLLSKFALELEGKRQRHCVGSYSNAVQRGSYAIVSLMYKDTRYTIALDKLFHSSKLSNNVPIPAINQVKGHSNAVAPKEVLEKIHKDLSIIYKQKNN